MALRFLLLPFIYIRLLSFWLILFFLERLIVVAYFFNRLPSKKVVDIIDIFINSIRLDLSMAAYLVSIPMLLTILNMYFSKNSWSKVALKYYHFLFIVLYLLIGFANMNLYREWGTKINFKAVHTFLEFPYEVAISGFTRALLIPVFLYSILGFLAFKLRAILLDSFSFNSFKNNKIELYGLPIALLAVNFLFIRGGWQLTPINVSMAQYSTVPLYNHLSTNTMWQFMQNVYFELKPVKSRYVYFSEKTMERILHQESAEDSTIHILKPTVTNPNVVLIILESYTSDLIESLGGESGVSPNIEKIIKKGILFTNIYSSGDRTEKGIISILSSFPSQATRSIIRDSHKQIHLPSMAQQFKKRNYRTSFYYGGESEFFGLKSYLLMHDFEVVVDKNVFQTKDFNSKWGAHDGVLFDKHLNDFTSHQEPFFTTILTLSNHEPFEIPIPKKYRGDDLASLFRNTAYYTDLSLGEYIQKAKQQSWYDNTLFIIVADHGHRLPLNSYEIWDYHRHRIPLLFFGNVVREELQGTQNNIYGSQTDIAQTIYNQLDMTVSPNFWSKDLFSSNKKDRFAFYNWDNGFGLVGDGFSLSYNEDAKKPIDVLVSGSVINKETKLNFAKAYMQKIFSQYMSY